MDFERCMEKAEYILEQLPLFNLPQSESKQTVRCEKSYGHIYSRPTAKTASTDKNLYSASGVLKDYFENGEPKSKLVLCLLPLDEGYCVNIMDRDENIIETLEFSYEENELLDYFDNEVIPPLLCNTLDGVCSDIYISGCVPAEVRDYRISVNPSFYKSSYILLKSTALNMQEDINAIAEMSSDTYKWTPDDKLALESTLTLATSAPLCLDPSPSVMIIKNKLRNRNSFKNQTFKRKLKNQSGIALKRQKIFASRKLSRPLFLNEFLKNRKSKEKKTSDLRLPKNVIDIWRKDDLVLSPPSNINDVEKLSKAIQWPDNLSDKDILEVQTIHLESEGQNRDVYSRITIGQRPGDMKYFGTLHSNKYFKHSIEEKALAPQSVFPLGSEHRANLYILQYQELFTEDGRRPAKVSVVKSGQNEEKSFLIPNQQQPWELVQDKSVYSVGSVVDIPVNIWTNLKMKRSYNKLEVNSTLHHHPVPNKPTPKQQHAQVTLGNVRGQIQGQHFVLANGGGSIRQKLLRTKSSSAAEGNRNEVMIVNSQQPRLKAVTQQTIKTENVNENSLEAAQQQQPQQANFKTILTAPNQQQTLLRMPVQARNTNGQITAINLLNTSTGQSLIGPNGTVLGNIQITAGPGGSLTIPASQLSAAGITMQLNTGNKNAGVPQQITLVPTNTLQASTGQHITLVNNQRTATTSGQITLGNIRNWQQGVNMQTVNIQQQQQTPQNDNKLQQSVFISRGGQQQILQRTLSQPQELPRMTYIAPTSGDQIVLQSTQTTVRPRISKDQEKYAKGS